MMSGMPFVLVHGGGFAGSCWDRLLPVLGGSAYAVDLPGRGDNPGDLSTITVDDFVSAVSDVIVDNDLHEVVLVGHSLAGVTLPGVTEQVPDRLARVVYVSCSVPAQGTSVAETLVDLSPTVSHLAEHLGDGADVVDSRGALHPDIATAMFCNDMDEEQTAFTLERMVPEAPGPISEATDLTGLRHPIPRTYVRLAFDASIDLEAQDRMIGNLGDTEVIDLAAGHMAMISQPDELAQLLNRMVR
jgi:pimeloyl-ACP methyl ester carboxylesterase